MLTVVCWKWNATGNWKKYTADHVNALRAMVERHCPVPFEFVCITDHPGGLDQRIRVVPVAAASAPVPDMVVPQRNCFRRVRIFATDMRRLLGSRILQLDLDTVIVGDLGPIVSRTEDFVVWKSPSKGRQGWAFNPSLILMDAGARAHVWETYRAAPKAIAMAAHDAGWTSTDQSVMSHLLSPDEATFGEADGVYAFRDHLDGGKRALPADARIVHFYDRFDPADPALQRVAPWITEHWTPVAC